MILRLLSHNKGRVGAKPKLFTFWFFIEKICRLLHGEGQGVLSGFIVKRRGLASSMVLVQMTPKFSEGHKMTISHAHGFYRSGQGIEEIPCL